MAAERQAVDPHGLDGLELTHARLQRIDEILERLGNPHRTELELGDLFDLIEGAQAGRTLHQDSVGIDDVAGRSGDGPDGVDDE